MINPYGQIPTIMFQEEDQILMADGTLRHVPTSSLANPNVPAMPLHMLVDMDELMEFFDIIDSETGEIKGRMQGFEFMVILTSYYIAKAKKRDAAEESALTPVTDIPPPPNPGLSLPSTESEFVMRPVSLQEGEELDE